MRLGNFVLERRSKTIESDGGRKVKYQILDWDSLYKQAMGEPWDWGNSLSTQDCMKVAPVSAGVNFLANSIASLPTRLFERLEPEGKGKPEKRQIRGGMLDDVLNHYWTEDDDAFTAKAWVIYQMMLEGVAYIYVERNLAGRILRLIPLQKSTISVSWKDGRKRYRYDPDGHPRLGHRAKYYSTRDIIEIAYRYKPDRITPVSLLQDASSAIAVYRAIEAYSAKFFGGGGVPPLAVYLPVSTTEDAARRMKGDVSDAITRTNISGDLILAMPYGHEVKPIGINPEQMQMISAKQYQLTEIARYLNLSPIFLQDLTHGTFNNSEQQALHVVKNTVRPLSNKVDKRLTLALFGRGDNRFVRSDLNELLRGDIVSRFNSFARAIQGGFMTPNEVRAREGLPALEQEEAEKLHMQTGTVLLGGQDNQPALDKPVPSPDDNPPEDE